MRITPDWSREERARALRARIAVDEEVSHRRTRSGRLRVVELSAERNPGGPLFKEGTLVCLVGPGESRHIRAVTEAIDARDPFRIRVASEAILRHQYDALVRIEGTTELAAIPVIVDITYRSRAVATQMIVHGALDVVWESTVWSGGQLDATAFAVVEHHRGDPQRPVLEVLIVLNAPRLTPIERAVLDAIPPALSDVHILAPSVAWTTMTATAPFLVPSMAERDEGRRHARAADDGRQQAQQVDAKQQERGQQAQQVDAKQQERGQQQQQEADARQRAGAQQQQQDLAAAQQQDRHQQQADARQQQQQQQRQAEGQQQQQQQQDERGQQQQQQQQQQAENRQQEQQQQQQQAENRQQQQQQQQQERQQETPQRQQQQQQQQNQDQAGQQQQQQQQQQSARFLDFTRQGYDPMRFDQVVYDRELDRVDFSALDATQSVSELLRLREFLLDRGLA